MDDDTEVPQPAGLDREKTAPFLVRTFVKIGSFHRPGLFEDGAIPTTDEHQIFTWKDATLKEVLTTLREVAPPSLEFRHPLARYSFKALYADATQRGAFTSKELGMVYSRDVLGEPGSLVASTGEDGKPLDPTPDEEEKLHQEKTLEDLRFMPGDYLLVAIILPKTLSGPPSSTPGSLSIKGTSTNGAGAPPGKWGRTDSGWNSPASAHPSGGFGRGGAHWRARPGVAAPTGRGAGDRGRDGNHVGRRDSPPFRGGGDRFRGDRERDRERPRERERERERERDRDRERDRERDRVRDRDRDRHRDRRSTSRSPPPRRSRSPPPRRSRSPPPRRRRYD